MIKILILINDGQIGGGMEVQNANTQEIALSITQLELFKKKQLEEMEKLVKK